MAESEHGPGLSDCRTCALRFLLPKLWMTEMKLQRKRQNGKGKKERRKKKRGLPRLRLPPARAGDAGLKPPQ